MKNERLVAYAAAVGIQQIRRTNAAEFYARAVTYDTAHGLEPITPAEIRKNISWRAQDNWFPGGFVEMNRSAFRKWMGEDGKKVEFFEEMERLKAVYELAPQ